MDKLCRGDLYSLERYAEERTEFRRRVLAHKRSRQVALGPHLTLYFEDRLTVQYQIQEMLRVERIFEPAGIEEELEAYNPLIPDGSNFKATVMIEYTDPGARRDALTRLKGVENRIALRVAQLDPIVAIADEDLERGTDDKTSAVHFVRFELPPAVAGAAKGGAAIGFEVTHPYYHYRTAALPDTVRDSLAGDLD